MTSAFFSKLRTPLLVGLMALGIIGLSACDSDDDGDLDNVSGVYAAQRLMFITDGSLVADVDVLSRASDVEVEFFPSDGEFDLTYAFQEDDGQTERHRITGSYDVSGDEAQLDVDDDDQANRRQLLLPDTFDLDLDGDQLSGDISRNNVDLGDFSEEDFGNVEVDGTLEFRLSQQ